MKTQKGGRTKAFFYFLSGLLGLWIALLPACLDVIDIETPIDNQESLVIQGKLVVGSPSLIQVKLSKLFNFTAEGKKPLNAQSVIVFDEDNNRLELDDRGLGNYRLIIPADHPTFKVELGKKYGIQVKTFDGRTFESAMEQADPVPAVELLDYQLVQREVVNQAGTTTQQEYLQYLITTPLRHAEAQRNVRLGWEYEQTFKVNDTPFQQNVVQKVCYITENLNVSDIKVVDSDALSGDRLENYELFETLVSRVYGEGLYFSVIQESLSETAYEYFTQVAENTGRTGNMFESPPGKVVSNMRNVNNEEDEAFGFFYVTQQDTIRKYIDPATIGAPPAYCPPPNGIVRENGSCADPICCDCLSVPNSTIQKPSFWVE